LLKISKQLKSRNTDLYIDNLSICTDTPSGQMIFTILGAVAQMERELIRERGIKGLQNRKDKGLKLGKPFSLDKSKMYQIYKLREKNYSIRKIAKKVDSNPATICDYLNGKYGSDGSETRC